MELNDEEPYLMEFPNDLHCTKIEKIVLSFECLGRKVIISDLFVGGCKCEETGQLMSSFFLFIDSSFETKLQIDYIISGNANTLQYPYP